jgi:hypothetical protein
MTLYQSCFFLCPVGWSTLVGGSGNQTANWIGKDGSPASWASMASRCDPLLLQAIMVAVLVCLLAWL